MSFTHRYCDGIRRRDFVSVGSLTALGLGLADLLRYQAANAAAFEQPVPPAKACILIWLDGGPSHLESFDPKPHAPAEVRGPLASIPTVLPGIRLGECLPHTANRLHDLAIIRSMTSPLGEHGFGTHYMLTGYKPSPALEYPTYGATLAALKPRRSVLPPYMAVPTFDADLSGYGFLDRATAPFAIGGDPERSEFKVRDLDFYPGIDLQRIRRRREYVNALDGFSRFVDSGSLATNPNLDRAYSLIASPDAKRAFDLREEDDRVRAQYGRSGGNGVGQSCLLARRLVERGVPFVTVHSTGWDTHQDIAKLKERYPGDRNAHLPALDRALSALLTDLADRGMLAETLVMVMGEFGRTPKLNANGGRDHWPNVFSMALAGGGVRGGQIIGSSDSLGEFPDERPVTPSDLAATVFTVLGIDPSHEQQTSDGRPVRVAPDGARVIAGLLG